MNEKDNVRTSKFLSLVLRHKPDLIGLSLDGNGWVEVSELILKCNESGHQIDFDTLKYIVDTNPKKRFAFSEDQTRIRASQGHSVAIDLDLVPRTPPEILYHGTAVTNLVAIRELGLQKRLRHHVHLSADKDTALQVGTRHGKPVVLEVLALKMHEKGFAFFQSANGVWLIDEVPTRFIR